MIQTEDWAGSIGQNAQAARCDAVTSAGDLRHSL